MNVLVVDAGPLIGLFQRADAFHEESVRGFQELRHSRVRVLAPLPVVFEVYKWILYNINYVAAQEALDGMQRSLEITNVTADILRSLADITERLPNWGGSLEDALVLFAARSLGCPAWTYNSRDFAAFRDLELWNPS